MLTERQRIFNELAKRADRLNSVADVCLDEIARLRAIEAEVLQAQEPVAWMSPGKERIEFSRPDTVYGSHTIPLYPSPQPPAPCPKCEGRANGTLVSMPVGELKKLRSKVAGQSVEIERLTKAVTPVPLPEYAVPHAFMLEETRRYAGYWEDGARNEHDRGKALICLHQSVNGWKNAAYAMAEKLLAAQSTIAQQAERIAELEKVAKAYEDQVAAHNKTLGEVARLSALIEKCEKALRSAVEWGAPMQDAPKSSRPYWFGDSVTALAAIAAQKQPSPSSDLRDPYEQITDFSEGTYHGT